MCRSLLWGTWVINHFYAIVKGPEKIGGDQNASVAQGGEMGLTIGAGEGVRAVERNRGGGEDDEERIINGTVWYSLDSRLPKPLRLGGTSGLMAHLSSEIREHHGHVFVVGNGVEEAQEA